MARSSKQRAELAAPVPSKRPDRSATDRIRSWQAAFDQWRLTRDWRTVAWGVLPLTLVAFVIGLIMWGASLGEQAIAAIYIKEAEDAAPIKEDGDGAEFDDGEATSAAGNDDRLKAERTRYATLLFRRVLDGREENDRARYYVAAQRAARGDVPLARIEMISLAPESEIGYPPAHAWLAADLFNRARAGEGIDVKLLRHHLAGASRWGGTHPALLVQYAQMLEMGKSINQALNLYSLAGQRDPDYLLVAAEALRRNNQPVQTGQLLQEAIDHFERRLSDPPADPSDAVKLSQAFVMKGEYDAAVLALQKHLTASNQNERLADAIGDVYVAAYRNAAVAGTGNVSVNVQLLEKTLQLAPNHTGANAELVRLASLLIASTQQANAAGQEPSIDSDAAQVTAPKNESPDQAGGDGPNAIVDQAGDGRSAEPATEQPSDESLLELFAKEETPIGEDNDDSDEGPKAAAAEPEIDSKQGESVTLPERNIATLRSYLAAGQAPMVTHLIFALLHLDRQEYSEAVLHLRVANELNPSSVLANRLLYSALVRQDKQNAVDAIGNLKRLLKQHPDDLDLRATLGELQTINGDYEEAIATYRSIIATNPTAIGIYERLIKLLEDQKRVIEARALQTDLGNLVAKLNARRQAANQFQLELVQAMARDDEQTAAVELPPLQPANTQQTPEETSGTDSTAVERPAMEAESLLELLNQLPK